MFSSGEPVTASKEPETLQTWTQKRLLQTWKPVFVLAHLTCQTLLDCCPKSSAIDFAVKTFDCLLE